MSAGGYSTGDAALFRLARSGDKAAVERVVEENMGLVVKAARYYAQRNPLIDRDDLVQSGTIGLLRAIEKFDVDRGYKFSTYAMHWIKQVIQRHVVSCHSRGMSAGKKDTESYIHGSASPEMVRLYEMRCFSSISLNGGTRADGDHDLVEVIESEDISVEEEVEQRIVATQLGKAINSVASDRDAWVVTEYFGLFGRTPRTMREIALELGITGQGVKRIIDGTILKLRAVYGVEDDE